MKEVLKKINIENLLYIFIISCPILDMMSFLFRNTFKTNFSPSTVIRPIISIIVILYIFMKDKNKIKIFVVGALYATYAGIHLYLFKNVLTGSSYSGVIHEAQYLVNYSFMILNLFIFQYVFKDKDTKKLKNSLFYAIIIYILSISIAIFTGTSSVTYEDGTGLKGWYESGNSIGSILLISLFVIFPYIKNSEYKKIAIPIILLIGLFLTTKLGTRTGLYGFILVTILYAIVEGIFALKSKKKISKKTLKIGAIGIVAMLLIIIVVGSNTLQRRKNLKEEESKIIDNTTQEPAHITGDLLDIKEKIENGTLPEGYMGEAEKKSIIDLYNISKDMNLSHTQLRTIQVIYNLALVKNQANPMLILFGNGYMANFYELVLEMEIPAFLLNFGLIGFILYFVPFLAIFIYACYKMIKNIKKVDSEFIMLILGSGFTFALSFLSGYTFFNSSSMIVIIIVHMLLLKKAKEY